jgi:hypothetical protein
MQAQEIQILAQGFQAQQLKLSAPPSERHSSNALSSRHNKFKKIASGMATAQT